MRVLIVDFWSDGNIGDAIMQCEILKQVSSKSSDIHVISCFGENQFQLNGFNESLNFDNVTWHPSFFNTYIKLDSYSEKQNVSRLTRLMRTFISLVSANFRLNIYKKFKISSLLGRHSYLEKMHFDAIVFNGRNYRDFNGLIKNFINNQPLLINQRLVNELFDKAPKINAGFSTWGLDGSVKSFIENNWCNYKTNVARESYTKKYMERFVGVGTDYKKDLSFDYLQDKVQIQDGYNKRIAFSLTNVGDVDLYLKQINEILHHYYNLGYEVILVDQVYLEHESTDFLLPKIEIPFERFSSKKIDKILSMYNTCEFVLSTRMHGSIMALSQGCKVASLAYDSGAKWSILIDEINNYPMFSPGKTPSSEIIAYLESEKAPIDSYVFADVLKQSGDKYVEKFLYNINT
ncbi:polysaccharide pyruvyl transferase family protein [Psychroserpens sp.]|jgi:polysaccharide pyruvyl transferase WcaK-like protein|uniref:polysaccharide pyruvyl transferase family protein n=1 Tax=Psychroserpens sp. TaxID=2020870 RepID=UPI0039E3E5ED